MSEGLRESGFDIVSQPSVERVCAHCIFFTMTFIFQFRINP
jgi:hypothetical protein